MLQYIKKNALWLIIALLAGAILMDYYNYLQAKDKNYSKISGLFKYTAKNLL
jgi:hypothetical protein